MAENNGKGKGGGRLEVLGRGSYSYEGHLKVENKCRGFMRHIARKGVCVRKRFE